jgi:hypothetical protein
VVVVLVVDGQLLEPFAGELAPAAGADVGEQAERPFPVTALALCNFAVQFGQHLLPLLCIHR